MSKHPRAAQYGRFLAGRAVPQGTTDLARSRAAIERRLAEREALLLRVAARGFFGHPRSPYRELLAIAGCEYADFRALVLSRGIAAALRSLREAGVHFTFEEFKGREPVVRAGREIAVAQDQFDNPYLSYYYGTRTAARRRGRARLDDLTHLAVQAEQRLGSWLRTASRDPVRDLRPPLPSGRGSIVLRAAKWGAPPDRWFTPLVHRDFRPGLRFRIANSATIALGRIYGARLPWPEAVPIDRADRIAAWLAHARDRHGAALLNTTVSNGVRIAVAAREAGWTSRARRSGWPASR